MTEKFALALHGGAGTIAPGDASEGPYLEGLRSALDCGQRILTAGGTAVDAVVATVQSLELCPLFNAGYGAVYNERAEHELDAAIMDGRTLAAGAVAAVRRIKSPIAAARAVMHQGRSVLLAGDGAEAVAGACGLELVCPDYFSTEYRRAQLETQRRLSRDTQVLDHDAAASDARFGTVGAVALDRHGHLAAATSTGGMTNKQYGRIGDTPVIGAGTYANDATCAVSATGTGEAFLRACVGHDIHARIRYGGVGLDAAVSATLAESVAPLGGSGGVIAISSRGELSLRFNSVGMYRAWVREGEPANASIF